MSPFGMGEEAWGLAVLLGLFGLIAWELAVGLPAVVKDLLAPGWDEPSADAGDDKG